MKPRHLIESDANYLDIDAMISSAHDASGFLKALAHEARLTILCLLIGGEKSVTEIEETLRLRQPAISQQLARLRTDCLVGTRREGKNIFYSLARPEIHAIISVLHQAFCPQPHSRTGNKRKVARTAAHPKRPGRRVASAPTKRRRPAVR